MKTVIWIIGTPFSGSTIMQNYLSRYSNVFVAGEVDRFRFFGMHDHLKGKDSIYIDKCTYCNDFVNEKCHIWNDYLLNKIKSIGYSPRIYDVISEAVGSDVIIDSSKTPYWFSTLMRSSDYIDWPGRIIAVHTIRHPLAYAASMMRRMHSWSDRKAVADWVDVNTAATATIFRSPRPLPMVLSRHSDFLSDKQRMLKQLRMWVDLGDCDESHPERALHFLGGNPSAYPYKVNRSLIDPGFHATHEIVEKKGDLQDDDSWKDKFSVQQIRDLWNMWGVRDVAGLYGYFHEL